MFTRRIALGIEGVWPTLAIDGVVARENWLPRWDRATLRRPKLWSAGGSDVRMKSGFRPLTKTMIAAMCVAKGGCYELGNRLAIGLH